METLLVTDCVSPRLVGHLTMHLPFRRMWQCSHSHGLDSTVITAQKSPTLQDKLATAFLRMSQGQGAIQEQPIPDLVPTAGLLKPEKELHECNV